MSKHTVTAAITVTTEPGDEAAGMHADMAASNALELGVKAGLIDGFKVEFVDSAE